MTDDERALLLIVADAVAEDIDTHFLKRRIINELLTRLKLILPKD